MREAVFGALEAANTAFGLAPFAFDRLPRLLADLPSALPPGGDPDLLDPCLLEAGGHSRQTGPPIVDQQLGSGLGPEHVAIRLQGCLRHLVLVGPRGDPLPKQIATGQAVDEPLHAKFHVAAAFGDRPRGRIPG